MATNSYDIVIVGGGMVGASLTLLLANQPRNWRILVVEAYPQQPSAGDYSPSFDDRSTALSYQTQQIFANVGLWPAMASRAAAIDQIQVSDRGHIASTELNAREQGVAAYGYVVENRWLGTVLNGALADTNIEMAAPAMVEQVVMKAGGAEITLSDREEPINAKLLVIADGANSPTREKLGIGVRVEDYNQMGLIANIALAQPHNGTAYERFTEQGPMALLPLADDSNGGHRSALVWTLPLSQAQHLKDCSETEFLAELHRCFGYRQGELVGVGERQLYPLKLMETTEQVRRNVAVIGNAAHSLHPVAGQGFNLAMRDVSALAEALQQGAIQGQSPGDLALLQKYVEQQQADQQRTVAASDWLPKLFSINSPAVALARGAGLFTLDMIPAVRGQFARYGMGLE